MEKQLKIAFSQVKMDDHCAERIEQAMLKKAVKSPVIPRWGWQTGASVAAACLLVMFLFSNAEVVGAKEIVLDKITEALFGFRTNPVEMIKGSDYIIERDIDSSGKPIYSSNFPRTVPSWLNEKDGRLFFVGNGQNTDITDLISDEEPFTYAFTDPSGITSYIAVGGNYNAEAGISEGVYWAQWLRNAADTAEDPWGGWISGYAKGHWNNKTDEEFGWYTKAKEIMDIPWS